MKVILMLFIHYLLDYPLQGEFLFQTKGKYFYSLFVHSMIYGLGMSLAFEFMGIFAWWKVIILVGSHIIIDHIKANAKDKDKALTTYLYLDQAIHISINLILLL